MSHYTHDWTIHDYRMLWQLYKQGTSLPEIALAMGLREAQIQGQLSVVKKAVWLIEHGLFDSVQPEGLLANLGADGASY